MEWLLAIAREESTLLRPILPKNKATSLELHLPDLCIRAQVWGWDSAPYKILALHGWLDNSATFALLAPLLDNVQIVAVDMPGHGLSDHKPGQQYHYIEAVQDVIDIIDALKWDKCILLGHSMGGSIGGIVSASFPERISRLILIDAIGALTTSAKQTPARLRESIFRIQKLRQKPIKAYDDIEVAINLRMQNNDLSHAAATLLCQRGMREEDGQFYWRHDTKLLYPSLQRFTDEQILVFLQQIQCPTCLIRALPGYGFDQAKFTHASKQVSNIQCHDIASNHYPHLEYPEQVATILQAFINAEKDDD